MVLKGSVTRSISHAGRLGRHLLNEQDNDRVSVIEVSGHATDDPQRALLFMHGAVSLTKGRDGLFQVSINPEEGETMSDEQWKDAVAKIEKEFGFEGQPRLIIGHVKEGREHVHCVWQRTDLDTEKVIPLDKYKTRLKGLAREMEREYEHRQVNDKSKSHGFDQDAFRQAKRNKDRDPRQRSAFIREAWEKSETPDQFRAILKGAGYELATGNKSRFVLVDAGSGDIIRGSFARHLKGEGRSGPKAAELREWAKGLSEPLAPVQAVKERIIEGQYFDRDKYNAAQQTRDEQAGIEQAEDQQEQERFAKSYKSFADDLDPLRERDNVIHLERARKEAELKAFYKRDQLAAQLEAKRAALAQKQGLAGRITGRGLESEIAALEKQLSTIDQRTAEQWEAFDRRIEKQWPDLQSKRSAPAPSNENAPQAQPPEDMSEPFQNAPDAGRDFDSAATGEHQQPASDQAGKIATKAEQERLEAQRSVPQAAPAPTPPGGQQPTQAWKQESIEREEEIQRIQNSRETASQKLNEGFARSAPAQETPAASPANENAPEQDAEAAFAQKMRERNAAREQSREQERDAGMDI